MLGAVQADQLTTRCLRVPLQLFLFIKARMAAVSGHGRLSRPRLLRLLLPCVHASHRRAALCDLYAKKRLADGLSRVLCRHFNAPLALSWCGSAFEAQLHPLVLQEDKAPRPALLQEIYQFFPPNSIGAGVPRAADVGPSRMSLTPWHCANALQRRQCVLMLCNLALQRPPT